MKRQMESLGGWPVVEGKGWQTNRWSWQRVMLDLELRGFRGNFLYESTIQADMKNSSHRVIYVSEDFSY